MVRNPTVIELRSKVHVTADERFSEHEAFVSVEFADSKTLDVYLEHALGSIKTPLSTPQLKDKFIEHVGSVIGKQRAEKAFRASSQIANTSNVGPISRELRT